LGFDTSGLLFIEEENRSFTHAHWAEKLHLLGSATRSILNQIEGLCVNRFTLASFHFVLNIYYLVDVDLEIIFDEFFLGLLQHFLV